MLEQEVTTINKRGTAAIEGVSVNFNWAYEEGEITTHISANATTTDGMSCNLGYNIPTENVSEQSASMEIQIYGLKGEIPTALLEGIKNELKEIENSFNA